MKLKSFKATVLALSLLTTASVSYACQQENELLVPPNVNGAESILPPDHSLENGDIGENVSNQPNQNENQTSPPLNSTPAPDPEQTVPVKQEQLYIRATGDSVNLRSGAGTSYSVLGKAEKGTSYAVAATSENWYQTFYRGKKVYFHASYATVFTIEKSDNKDVENVIEEGYKLLGVPYVYGAVRFHDGNGKLLSGFSAQKFDCSSLVQYIFYKGANVLLQVNTRTQFPQGKKVKKSELKRGDCLYFTNSQRQHLTGVERVGHVALYLGDNYILHTASDYARIEQISSTRWGYFIEGRRFV